MTRASERPRRHTRSLETVGEPSVVLIDAVGNVVGGGITVAERLTEAMARLAPSHRFVLYFSNQQIARGDYPANVELVHLPRLASRAHRWPWEQVVFPREARRRGAKVLLCLGGYAIFATRTPQVAVWQNANVFSPPGIPRPWPENAYVWAQRRVQALSMRKAAQNVFLTETSVKMAAKRWNMRRYPHTYIHSGIDRSRVLVSDPPPLQEREPLALSIGHAYPHKNYANLIDAMGEYRERHSEPLRLEIVGGAPDPAHFAALERRIRDLRLEDRVTMSGPASAEEVTAKLRRAKVYVVTSLLETFGLTMFEAMGAGVPVVASNATCHPEVCGDAVLYCDPHDPSDIAEKLRRVATDAELQLQLQKKGLERIAVFTWERAARRYLEVVEAAARATGIR